MVFICTVHYGHCIFQGAANRKVAATNMNRESSRSHSVFTCTIESKVYHTTIYIVTLAFMVRIFFIHVCFLMFINGFVLCYAVGIQLSDEYSIWAIESGGSCRIGEVNNILSGPFYKQF